MRALFVIFSALLWIFTTSGAADAQTPVKYLDWPGKAPAKAATPVVAPETTPQPAPQDVAPAPVTEPVAAAVTAPPQTFTPKSIYDAPPPIPAEAAATPAVAAVAATPATPADRARRYSLLRDYGEQPDHITVPSPVYLDHLPVDVADKAAKASKEAKDDASKDADGGDDDNDTGGGAD